MRFALLIASAGAIAAATQPISDTDLWWHLATGRETLAHGIVRADVFSWTVRGAAVPTDQWLGQVVLYGAYALLSWWGIALVRVLCVAALLSLIGWNVVREKPVRPIVLIAAVLPAFILTRVVWVDRPELIGLVCFAALLPLLRRADTASLVASVALIAFWANVHGSFALGVVLVVLAMIERAVNDRRGRARYIAAAFASLVAALLTPAGLATWSTPGLHLLSPPRDIQEWALIDPTTPLGIAYIITLALVLIAAIFGPRAPVSEYVVLVPVALLSLTAQRQAPLLAIAAAPLFASALQRRVAPSLTPSRSLGTLTFAAAAALFVLALAIAPREPDESAYPVAALTSLPNGDGTLARYEWGGWMIWRAPATPVFVDGRLVPYLGGVIDDYRRVIAAAPGFQDTLTRRGVRTLLVMPSDPVAVRAQELGWRVIARSSVFILIAVP